MEERNLRKTRTGKVVSDKMDKTIVVAVEDHVNKTSVKRQKMETCGDHGESKIIFEGGLPA